MKVITFYISSLAALKRNERKKIEDGVINLLKKLTAPKQIKIQVGVCAKVRISKRDDF